MTVGINLLLVVGIACLVLSNINIDKSIMHITNEVCYSKSDTLTITGAPAASQPDAIECPDIKQPYIQSGDLLVLQAGHNCIVFVFLVSVAYQEYYTYCRTRPDWKHALFNII